MKAWAIFMRSHHQDFLTEIVFDKPSVEDLAKYGNTRKKGVSYEIRWDELRPETETLVDCRIWWYVREGVNPNPLHLYAEEVEIKDSLG